MISINVTADTETATKFIVNITGKIKRPKELNEALGQSLELLIKDHFLIRNKVPNRLRGKRTNFWSNLRNTVKLEDLTDKGATVSIASGAFRIQLEGGTIKPTAGRKALTIPLVAAAHGVRVKDYEESTGKKLFRMGNALFERSSQGTQSLTGATRVSARGSNGQTRSLNLRGRSQVRAVYALVKQVTIKADPTALPSQAKILKSLNQEASDWLAKETKKGGVA